MSRMMGQIRSHALGLLALLGCALAADAGAADAASDPVATTRVRLQQAATQSRAAEKVPMIARANFTPAPGILDVHLAPDARHLSFLQRDDDERVSVWIQEVATAAAHRIVADVHTIELAWSGDGRHLWLADENGLAVVDAETLAAKRIRQWDARRPQRLWGVDPRTPEHAIVYEQASTDEAAQHRYLLVDLSGKATLLHAARWPLHSMTLRANGSIAFVAAFDGDRYDTVIRHHGEHGPRELMRCSGLERCDVLAHDDDERSAWLLSQHGETLTVLARWRAGPDRVETVHRDPEALVDADAVLWGAPGGGWRAIAYDSDRRHWHGRDAATNAQLTALQRQLPGANLQLSGNADRGVWLVHATQSDRPEDRYFLYDVARDRLQPVLAANTAKAASIAPTQLAPALAIDWRASDGMLLHGFVYLPSGVDPAKAPLIAWLHGGPIQRSGTGYDGRIQILVNRGYVVFAPNFRASSGYGLDYTRAAGGDVGNGRVLADSIDGLDFLLAQGIGDRNRQAVAGHSFGGYASLLAVSHHPQRFRFAFAGAPPTDYGWIKQWQAEHDVDAKFGDAPPLTHQFALHRMDFNDATWRARMLRESPLRALPELRTPIYLWAGTNDERVPLKSVTHYVAEAARLGKSVALLIDPVAGHAPRRALNAEAWLALLERAADRHFGGGSTPLSPALHDFIAQHLRVDTQRMFDRAPSQIAP